jgi:hypothetical protein
MALFDLSSSWVEGRCCELAAFGYSRDGKKGKAQIEYGLLTDPEGRPVAVRVFAGNTADPATFTAAVEAIREKFGITQAVMVGDREMITSARTTWPRSARPIIPVSGWSPAATRSWPPKGPASARTCWPPPRPSSPRSRPRSMTAGGLPRTRSACARAR